MEVFKKPLFLLLALHYFVYVRGQNDVQTYLNAFCANNPANPGCSSKPLITEGVPDGAIPGLDSGANVECQPGTKRCTQLPQMCVPSDIPCSALGSGRTCEEPKAINTERRVLVCGDGSSQRSVCGSRDRVPLLTVLIVQCLAPREIASGEHFSERLLQSLGVMEKPGSRKGAGIYMCDTTQTWRPLVGSPVLEDLLRSCLNAGCGYVPEPMKFMRVDRPWSWVRLLYVKDKPACSLTLVANNAAITAGHCVTRNPGSRKRSTLYKRIPGERRERDHSFIVLALVHIHLVSLSLLCDRPSLASHLSSFQPRDVFIHPLYDPNVQYIHDIAVITFDPNPDFFLPTVCIADEVVRPSRDRIQVISVLAQNRRNPEWLIRTSRWDENCQRLGPRNTFCQQQLSLRESQFCAQYEGIAITEGSSGGPYLAEIGRGVDEVWVLMGVLSNVNTASSCSQGHLIYSNVVDDSKWLKDCVFYRRCETFFSTVVQG
ncbi:uncharacterized protein LOC122243334 [Penaeus japonicus]|uniref:uncharacterized protein LOC122243334 n=1 Tax=Penaeus japonicus TaxID=27405 RepID=UPI001C7141F1|nr:uncharacterized protein LOC122243334 [Penaeus japonicus]